MAFKASHPGLQQVETRPGRGWACTGTDSVPHTRSAILPAYHGLRVLILRASCCVFGSWLCDMSLEWGLTRQEKLNKA